LKFAKYLPKHGWQPVIYTPENPDFDVRDESLLKDIPEEAEILKRPIWEPYAIGRKLTGEKGLNKGIVGEGSNPSMKKKFMNWFRGNFFIPDPRVYWRNPSVKFLQNYLKDHPVDLMITTGPPHSMHLIGLDLKKKVNIPWIADFRDPWSQLDFLDTFYVSPRNRKRYEHMESNVLDQCDRVLATSYSMPECLLPFDQSKFVCITNGYDTDDFTQPSNEDNKNEDLIIYHAGLLNKFRNPVKLWHALNMICEKDAHINEHLKLHFVGNIDQQVIQSINEYPNLKDKMIVEGYKTHHEVLQDYQKSTILLLLVNNSLNAKVNIPGKLFEYFAVSKPILAIGAKDADAIQLVRQTKTGVSFEYDETMTTESLESILNFRFHKDFNAKDQYSRNHLADDLASLMERMLMKS